MWAIGRYTKVSHRPVNSMMAENFMRSAKAPTMSAGVIAAKVSWKARKTNFGNRHALGEGVGGGLVGDAGEERLSRSRR